MAVAVQIHFDRSKTHPVEPQWDAISWLIGAMERNGSIFHRSIIVEADSGWIVQGIAPARDAFRKASQNDSVQRRLRKLKAAKVKHPTIRFLGDVPETAPDCKCTKPGALFLFTTFLHADPPLWCMDCNGVVPLYRLPGSKTEDHSALFTWQSSYQACDLLQINCTVGERFGERQMSDLTSSLTVSGLTICKELEKRTGRPVYYYLVRFASRSQRAEAARQCPNCGGEWRLDAPIHTKFNYKCERCHLLSNIGFNIR